MKYLLLIIFGSLIISGCMPSYICKSEDGSENIATIQTWKANQYLKTETVEQICEIVRKEIDKL